MGEQESMRETEKYPDNRLESPFSPEHLVVEGPIPRVAGITDTHLQSGMTNSLKERGISSGKANILGTSKNRVIRNLNRRVAQVNQIAMHTAREVLTESLKTAELLIHGGDVSDAMTSRGVVLDLLLLEEHFTNRLNQARGKDNKDQTFRGTIYITGNHDTDFLGADRMLRYDSIAKKFPQIPLPLYEEIIEKLENGESIKSVANLLGGKDIYALHPGLKWFLERKRFGQSLGIFFDKEQQKQVVFLDSELEAKSGSPESLARALMVDINLDIKNPKLYKKIVGQRIEDKQIQENLIEKVFESCEKVQTTVYAHDPIKMQELLIKKYQESRNTTEENAKAFVQANVVVWGGHWHTNDDGTAWARKGVRWWNGMSRVGLWYFPDRPQAGLLGNIKNRLFPQLKTPFLKHDYVSVLAGDLASPDVIKVAGDEVNKERERLYSMVETESPFEPVKRQVKEVVLAAIARLRQLI